MLNTVTLQGRLTRSPELRYTNTSTPVANFTLAVERDFKDGSGERQTDFIECVAWRGTAEFANKYFSKGSAAVVHGRLQQRRYVDRDGNNRSALEVIAENIYFAGSKPADEPRRDERSGGYDSARSQYSGGYGAFDELEDVDEDLPF